MIILKVIYYAVFLASGVCLIIGLNLEDLFLIVGALGGWVAGGLVMGLDRIVETLAEIRDKLPSQVPDVTALGVVDVPDASGDAPARSLEQISADIAAMKARTATP